MYGKRLISKWHFYSFSLGLSANNFHQFRTDASGQGYEFGTNYIGVPYELNVKWFKRRKERPYILFGWPLYNDHIYLGMPTGFVANIGFKIAGNVSNYTYVSVGAVFGFGWHKVYYM